MKIVVNILLFQVGWFACVLGAAEARAWLGPFVVALLLVLHGLLFQQVGDLKLVLLCAVTGLIVDSLLSYTSIARYHANPEPTWLAPPWIVAMWANLGMTLRHSLSWLAGRWILAAALGAAAGPLAYWSGAALGAMDLPRPLPASLTLAVVWGLSLTMLVWVADRR